MPGFHKSGHNNIDAPAVSCTFKQINLQVLFVVIAALLCQRVIVNKWV